MPRPELFPIKFQFAMSQEMDSAINLWRRQQPDLPNRSEAIRRTLAEHHCGRGHLSVHSPRRAATRPPVAEIEP